MSIRDPFYIEIEHALGAASLDTDLFERFAAELVQSKGHPTNLVVGGADNGYDFEIVDTLAEPGPGVATTSDRVTDNLKRNLDQNLKNCPHAAKKTFVVTSSILTPQKRESLKKAARERGYVLLGAADRAEVARYIYSNPHWARDLLGLSGQPSALSVVPRTSRPLVEVPLIGRDGALAALQGLTGDALLVGSPGSGKTALLSHLVTQGRASFMVTTDMAAVANAIRHQKPEMIAIDDLGDTIAAVRDLVRLRGEIGADFKIVATDWESDPGLQQLLGLGEDSIIHLERLTRPEMVDVVAAVGVTGPRQLVKEIVDQAEGVPGLAVTLTQTALAGDFQALFDANRLGTLMSATVVRLLGSPVEGGRAVLALGAISLAGDAGFSVEEVAAFLGCPKGDVYGLLRRLTPGGIIRPDRGRVTVRPRPLRRYMIREAFFGVSPVDYMPLLSVVSDMGETAEELVLAKRAGAVVPGLLDLVLASRSVNAARCFTGSGTREATSLLDAAPDLAVSVAGEALHTAPERVIPLLLAAAVGDERELHNTLDQPLRLIKDWANAGPLRAREAVTRKRAVVCSALKWAADGNDFYTACRACAEVLCTMFVGHELDPGAGMTVSITHGILTEEEIGELGSLWRDVRDAVEKAGDVPWPSLLSMCRDLVHPNAFGDPPKEAQQASRALGAAVIEDLGELAKNHPGVLDRLNTMRCHLGHEDRYSVPEDYPVLFGEYEHDDRKQEQKRRGDAIAALALEWSRKKPSEFACRLNWLREEAKVAGKWGYDLSPSLCHALAERVQDTRQWLTEMAAAEVSSDCLLPFLDRAITQGADDWEAIALPVLDDPSLEEAAVNVALRADGMSDAMWGRLAPRLPRHCLVIDLLCLRDQVPAATLSRLLDHESPVIAQSTAVGMWGGEVHGAIPEELSQRWQDAVVRIDADEYWLKEMLPSSPVMAERWLRARIENESWRALSNRENLRAAASALAEDQRLSILRALPESFYHEAVVGALLGDSESLYREVLRDKSLQTYWGDPLGRGPDETWRRLVRVALDEGLSADQIARASICRSGGYFGSQSGYFQGMIDEFSERLGDSDEDIGEVARLAIALLEERHRRALRDEREEAIEGR